MLRGRFWFETQDFGVSVGAIGIIFRDTSFPTSPRSQNRLFRKIVPGVQGRRNGRGKKLFTLLGPNCDQGGQTCCGADFGSRIKISGHPLGQSASFFEIYPFRPVLGGSILHMGGTDRFRKMMQIAPTDAPKSGFWCQNRLRNMFGHFGRNLASEV